MLGTVWAFAYRHRETEKNLCRGGTSHPESKNLNERTVGSTHVSRSVDSRAGLYTTKWVYLPSWIRTAFPRSSRHFPVWDVPSSEKREEKQILNFTTFRFSGDTRNSTNIGQKSELLSSIVKNLPLSVLWARWILLRCYTVSVDTM